MTLLTFLERWSNSFAVSNNVNYDLSWKFTNKIFLAISHNKGEGTVPKFSEGTGCNNAKFLSQQPILIGPYKSEAYPIPEQEVKGWTYVHFASNVSVHMVRLSGSMNW